MMLRSLLVFTRFILSCHAKNTVSFDSKALLINGERELILAGHIHYPRSTPEEWPSLFDKSKKAGLNAIDTYVFWNEHEEEKGIYDFKGRRDLRRFIKEAGEHGLYVILRIGPYICAETNLGGLPSWLLSVDGMITRTCNPKWKAAMQKFLKDIVEYVQDLFYTRNGSIILLQVENEFGNVQQSYSDGQKYIEWAVNTAESITKEVPWFVCQQDNVEQLINGCNGFYCDEWIMKRPFQNQPAFWIENWTGWYQKWGESQPYRPTQDLAFATLRFLAKGGSYVGYYMWHGGTFFGRSAGAGVVSVSNPGFITSYDYDAPLDEYGMPSEPKYSHLKNMHAVLNEFKNFLFENELKVETLSEIEIHSYGNLKFVSNLNKIKEKDIKLKGKYYKLPKWSVSIIFDGNELFNSATNLKPETKLEYTPIDTIYPSKISFAQETIGISTNDKPIFHDFPLDHFTITADKTDYMWYELDFEVVNEFKLRFEKVESYLSVFADKVFIGSSIGGKNIEFTMPSSKIGITKIQILSQTIGLSNYGGFFAEKKMGIIGKVFVNDQHVSTQWRHAPAFFKPPTKFAKLESRKLYMQQEPFKILNSENANSKRFVHYQIEFPDIPREENSYIALDLSTMEKGQLYFNGADLGRYWNIKGILAEDPPDLEIAANSSQREALPCAYAGKLSLLRHIQSC